MGRNVTVRFTPVYLDDKKLGDLENVTFDIDSGDEQIILTEGQAGLTEGATTTKASFDTITPADPTADGVRIVDAILKKKYVKVDVPWMGGIYSCTGKITAAAMASDPKSGKTTGKFSFMGGDLDKVA